MTIDLSALEVGPLERVEVFELYCEPVLYSCRDTTDRLYLAVLSRDAVDIKTWLFASLSPRLVSAGLSLTRTPPSLTMGSPTPPRTTASDA